jgi:hypothetical protein
MNRQTLIFIIGIKAEKKKEERESDAETILAQHAQFSEQLVPVRVRSSEQPRPRRNHPADQRKSFEQQSNKAKEAESSGVTVTVTFTAASKVRCDLLSPSTRTSLDAVAGTMSVDVN